MQSDFDHYQTVHGTAHDRAQWNRIAPHAPRMLTSAAYSTGRASELQEDLFRLLYQPLPQLLTDTDPSCTLNRTLVQAILGRPETETVRATTVNSFIAAGITAAEMATAAISTALKNSEIREQAGRLAQQPDPDVPRQAAAELRRQAERLRQLAETDPEVDDDAAEQEAAGLDGLAAGEDQAAADAEERQQQAAGALAQALAAQADGAVRRAATAALNKAEQAGEQVQAIQQIAGGDLAGMAEGVSAQALGDVTQLIATLARDRRLQTIARLIGRTRRIRERVKAAQIAGESGTVHQFRESRDVLHQTPVALATLASPTLRPLWRKAYAEGRLITHELRARDRVGRGPAVITLDRSGSMTNVVRSDLRTGSYTTREAWATAAAIAITQGMHAEGRDVTVINFGERAERIDLPRTTPPLQVVARLCAAPTCGDASTNFDAWLLEAVAILREPAHKQADVLCITDARTADEGHLRPDAAEAFRTTRAVTGARSFALMLGTQVAVEPQALLAPRYADHALYLGDTDDDTQAIEQLLARIEERPA